MRRAIILLGSSFFAFCIVQSANAEDFVINSDITNICLKVLPVENRLLCVGKAASTCMKENEGGETTVGMSACFGKELDWWDVKLNETYKTLLQRDEADDAEMRSLQSSAPQKAPVLKIMQRQWISYRDNLCEYEAVQWGGGTGGGPAFLSCLMTETARQYFVLSDRLGDSR